ncbi:hypothetical protein ACHAXR_001042, partial [Thalassiosira sp. AJA248-18]
PRLAPTVKPSAYPTRKPTKNPSNHPTLEPTTSAPTYLPTSTPSDDPEFSKLLSLFPYPYPYTRFTRWTELETFERDIARSLDYARNSWDNLEILYLESNRFIDLNVQQQQSISSLGMDENMWDCYVNHYNGYYWSDLQAAGAAQYYAVLGWSEESWEEGIGLPATEDMYWEELSEVQQEAGHMLCYFRNSWDWISLAAW